MINQTTLREIVEAYAEDPRFVDLFAREWTRWEGFARAAEDYISDPDDRKAFYDEMSEEFGGTRE
jgi:hypothetical protein